jgi:SAM-dependent methyltransferase
LCSDVEHLPGARSGEFDIVFSSYGVLHWLPDLGRWAEVIAHFLKPGGNFYLVEFHPFMRVFDTGSADLRATEPYLYSPEPYRFEAKGSYAAESHRAAFPGYMWDHGIGEVVTAVVAAVLKIEYLHEFLYAVGAVFPNMDRGRMAGGGSKSDTA